MRGCSNVDAVVLREVFAFVKAVVTVVLTLPHADEADLTLLQAFASPVFTFSATPETPDFTPDHAPDTAELIPDHAPEAVLIPPKHRTARI